MTAQISENYFEDTKSLGFLQLCIEGITEEMFKGGYSISIEHDFERLRDHLSTQGAVINPSFDPAEHDLAQAFWLRVDDQEGQTIACHAERIYSTDDFVSEFLASGRLWWHRTSPIPAETWRGQLAELPICLRGNVAYAGSMLISKPHRGRGLSLFLPYLSRALCLRNYRTSFHTGLVRESLAGSAVPTGNYGFPRTTPIFRGTLPGLIGPYEQVHLCWMDRHEGFARLTSLPEHPKFPIDLHCGAAVDTVATTVPTCNEQLEV